MILTGPAIQKAIKAGDITIRPFNSDGLNPNSYNYHLGEYLIVLGPGGHPNRKALMSQEGHVMQPGTVYLGSTMELIGSDKYVTLLLGRSSLGRLGLFLNVTADLGHLGSCSHWTLELTAVQPLRVYPGMTIGQVSFWLTDSASSHRYNGRYHRDSLPVANRDHTISRKLR